MLVFLRMRLLGPIIVMNLNLHVTVHLFQSLSLQHPMTVQEAGLAVAVGGKVLSFHPSSPADTG